MVGVDTDTGHPPPGLSFYRDTWSVMSPLCLPSVSRPQVSLLDGPLFIGTLGHHCTLGKQVEHEHIVKLRRGSGKDRQGMAVKAKGLKA